MVIDHFLLLCLSFSNLFKAFYTNSEVLELTRLGKYFYKSQLLFFNFNMGIVYIRICPHFDMIFIDDGFTLVIWARISFAQFYRGLVSVNTGLVD